MAVSFSLHALTESVLRRGQLSLGTKLYMGPTQGVHLISIKLLPVDKRPAPSVFVLHRWRPA